jgi:hypothetical protein
MKDRVSMKMLLKRTMDRSIAIRPTDDDILCGRGKHSCHHPGNVQFLKIVSYFKSLYSTSDNQAQIYITEGIIKMLKKRSPPVRFVTQDEDERGVWYEIPYVAAVEKTRQALRKKTTPKWAKISYRAEENAETLSMKKSDSNSKRLSPKTASITQNIDELQQANDDESIHQTHRSISLVVDLTLEPNETFSSNVPVVATKREKIVSDPIEIPKQVGTPFHHPSTSSSLYAKSNIIDEGKNILDISEIQAMDKFHSSINHLEEYRLRMESEKFADAFCHSRSESLRAFPSMSHTASDELWQLYESFVNQNNNVVNGPVVMKMHGNDGKLKCSNFMYQILVESLAGQN